MDAAFELRVATVRNRQADAVEAVGGCLSEASPQPDSVFQAASLSKPVFAYAVLKLVEQGKLTLDTPLLAYLPDGYRHQSDPFQLRPNSKGEQVTDARLAAVTVRMALNHTSGWPNWSSGPITFGSDPGTRWQYSGEGYVLLQRAVAVTGKKLDRCMSEQVFQPLKMLDSSAGHEETTEYLSNANFVCNRRVHLQWIACSVS
jgi:CubicO group peptidase (beta-lactamase class C family)